MASVAPRAMIEEVNVTSARSNIKSVFDGAVRGRRPAMIRRGRDELGLLLDRGLAMLALSEYSFHVDVIPEEGGGFTLWLNELEIGGSGEDLLEARGDLLAQVRFYVRDYLDDIAFYLRIPDKARQLRHVLRPARSLECRAAGDQDQGRERGSPSPRGAALARPGRVSRLHVFAANRRNERPLPPRFLRELPLTPTGGPSPAGFP